MDWAAIFENTVQRIRRRSTPCYFAIAAIGLNVQFGYTGLLNFGQAAFMACGAYGLGMTAHVLRDLVLVGDPRSASATRSSSVC